MKVIDLLNKIANKEEIPLIKYNGRILHYDYLNEWFGDKRDNGYCKMEVYYEDLNDEVEILDNKKIEKCEIKKVSQEFCITDKNNKDRFEVIRRDIEENAREIEYVKDILNKVVDKINEVE